jgi:hypothetical protein
MARLGCNLQKRLMDQLNDHVKAESTFIAALLTVLFLLPTLASADDNKCEKDLKQSSTTCQTKSLEGMDPSAQSLNDEIGTLNSSTGGIGNNQANQCQNQKARSEKSSQLANKKANACSQFAAACASSCKEAADEHKRKADLTQDAGTKAQENKKSKEFQGKADTCKNTDAPRAAEAQKQADSDAANAGTNNKCQEQSSTKPDDKKPEDKKSDDPSATQQALSAPIDCSASSNAGVGGCPGVGKTSGLSLSSSGGGTSGKASPASTADLGLGTKAIDGGSSNSPSATGSSGGGSGGGSGGFGSSGGSAATAKAAQDKADPKLNAGGSGASGGGGGGGSGGGGRGRGDNDPDMPNFLAKNKGIAGMSLKAVDGITGPSGKSLFEKVSTQYQLQLGNLLQAP